jgi:ABC-type polysaccharide/polyol phosphate transport system ATPase subunit
LSSLYENLSMGQHQVRDEQGLRDVAITLRDVTKRYVLRKTKPFLLREAMKKLTGRGSRREVFWALRGVNLTIRRGEFVGIVGRNGAGKSTLLGIMAGSVFPHTGDVEIHGRIGALLELGAGFHHDLTGRENIYLNASLLGLTEQEIDRQFESIVDFSELEKFIDVPLRNYSSGMHVRLGFSVAIHINPDILIMDEALAVGDFAFQKKCLARIAEFKARGKTLVFVSHGLDQVSGLCDRAVWLDQGVVRGDGPVREVLAAYAGGKA